VYSDEVFWDYGIEIVPLPYRAPNANAFAERWVRTVREECLDQLLIWNEAHLRRVLKEYVTLCWLKTLVRAWNCAQHRVVR